MENYTQRMPITRHHKTLNEKRFDNINRKPAILSNFKKGPSINFQALSPRTEAGSYIKLNENPPHYDRTGEAKDFLMKRLNLGSVEI